MACTPDGEELLQAAANHSPACVYTLIIENQSPVATANVKLDDEPLTPALPKWSHWILVWVLPCVGDERVSQV